MTGVLVHEWLAATGGSENVVEALAGIFPDAPITSLWEDPPSRFAPGRVSETWLARTPLRSAKALALPLMPSVWRQLPRSDAEWVLCSTHLFSHHARFAGPARDAPKYVYAHTPARYLWAPELDPRGASPLARFVAAPLRRLDRERAKEATAIAANSEFVRERIANAWHRESIVIHPPVRVAEFAIDSADDLSAPDQDVLGGLPSTFLLGASRFVAYKRLDVVIAAGRATGIPVVLAGEGPDESRLRALAADHPGTVTFVHRPSTALLSAMYRRALVYLFPSIEDFGIMPVESMATGTPVVANAIGGAAESVIHGTTGALLDSFSPASLKAAVELAAAVSAEACRTQAASFGADVFERRIREWMPS